jgi:repressor of nif and glnA expression
MTFGADQPNGLGPTQMAALVALAALNDTGTAPSAKDVHQRANHTGANHHPSSIAHALRRLRTRGLVTRGLGWPATWAITPTGRQALTETTPDPQATP